MPKIIRRFSIPLILTLALSACGADSGFSADELNATRDAALTEINLTLEYTPPPTASPSPSPTEDIAGTPSATGAPSRTATRPAANPGPLCDDAAYVSDVTIPDGTVIDPGDSFIKTWSIRNTGTCTWTAEYAIDFTNGSRMDGIITYVTGTVDPGESVELSVGLAAPTAPGTHTGYWRMKNANGEFFGEFVYVQIVVPGSATATETEEEDATAESEATDTLVPTATETLVSEE